MWDGGLIDLPRLMKDTGQHASHTGAAEPLLQSVVGSLREALDEVQEARRCIRAVKLHRNPMRCGDALRPPRYGDLRALDSLGDAERLLESTQENLANTLIGLRLVQKGAAHRGDPSSTTPD